MREGVWDMKNQERRCARCGDWKPFTEFAKAKTKKCGIHSYCRPCDNQNPARKSTAYMEMKRAGVRDYHHRHRKRLTARRRQRRQTDLQFRLCGNLRSRLYAALRRGRGVKSEGTLKLIGCSVCELRKHIESQFDPEMSWSNYGDWEIDHIRPCVSFDLTDPVQQRECFNWRNLQPLWKEDNRSKGAKWTA